ncbi:MAG: hypothetical protein HY332_01400 [Chloroflexi bacterium]|nr:hypothetical protein [Chloroflexota bacterium]
MIRQRRTIAVTDEQRVELRLLRDKGAKPYLRERSAAILKVADGLALTAVAQHGLLRPRDYETVGEWLDRFEERGVSGLSILKGRGRKPAFSPSAPGRRAGEDRDPQRGPPRPSPVWHRGHALEPRCHQAGL